MKNIISLIVVFILKKILPGYSYIITTYWYKHQVVYLYILVFYYVGSFFVFLLVSRIIIKKWCFVFVVYVYMSRSYKVYR
jgi:hypothetical protein